MIVFLSTCIFLGLLYKEYSNLSGYMEYISENGRSALFHEEHLNQNLAFKLSYAFSAGNQIDSHSTALCNQLEKTNGVEGFNLVDHRFKPLGGMLQTTNKDCEQWVNDIKSLPLINLASQKKSLKYTFSNYTGYTFNNLRYYIDIEHNYVYSNQLIDTNRFKFNPWFIFAKKGLSDEKNEHYLTFGIKSLQDLKAGENIISHVYPDGYTKNNIISMLTPVFKNKTVKGVLITDINISDLATSFYTADRPLIWKFLSLFLVDNTTGETINFHRPSAHIKSLIHHEEAITQYYTLHITLDMTYFIISNLWLLITYLVTTYLLCAYANYQLERHARLAKENITDVMTGLYNRKILSPSLKKRIDTLLNKHIDITIVAMDCDGLKKINDTLGHHAGDRMIQALAKAIDLSIRKSDYGIRLGGDEFTIILVDNTPESARCIVRRIQQNLAAINTGFPVEFSYGCYGMQRHESLVSAFKKADEALYQHKKSKRRP